MTNWLQLTGQESREERIALLAQAAEVLASSGVFQCVADDEVLTGRTLSVGGRRMLHFGNCSYLGLETDARLKAGACQAVERYGTQFSSSRSFCSVPAYRELEALLSEVVGGYPLVLAPTTTLAHLAALPILIAEGDVVLYDEHVHHSVQSALPQLAVRRIPCHSVKHNSIEDLEQKTAELSQSFRRVFYLCDGVYSMQGDTLDVPQLYALLDRHPKLHAYADDAHGMAWTGRRGAGVVLGFHALHPRMVVVLGLAKGFGSAGAAIVCPNPELANRIFSCGSSLVFSGPMQPAQLGAGIAAAKILLSDELPLMQAEVRARIAHFDRLCSDAQIHVPAAAGSPIRFVPVGDEQQTLDLCMKLQRDGHFTNISLFPAVPRGGAGVRIVLTRHLTLGDIEQLVISLRRHCPLQQKVRQAA